MRARLIRPYPHELPDYFRPKVQSICYRRKSLLIADKNGLVYKLGDYSGCVNWIGAVWLCQLWLCKPAHRFLTLFVSILILPRVQRREASR
jgi:hypothetical protein